MPDSSLGPPKSRNLEPSQSANNDRPGSRELGAGGAWRWSCAPLRVARRKTTPAASTFMASVKYDAQVVYPGHGDSGGIYSAARGGAGASRSLQAALLKWRPLLWVEIRILQK